MRDYYVMYQYIRNNGWTVNISAFYCSIISISSIISMYIVLLYLSHHVHPSIHMLYTILIAGNANL